MLHVCLCTIVYPVFGPFLVQCLKTPFLGPEHQTARGPVVTEEIIIILSKWFAFLAALTYLKTLQTWQTGQSRWKFTFCIGFTDRHGCMAREGQYMKFGGHVYNTEFYKKSLLRSEAILQMVDRKRDVSLTVHFLYQCHMVFHLSPAPLGDRKQSWVHSFLWEKWMWSQIMNNSFTSSSPRYILDPFFTRHMSSEHSDTKMTFFRHTNQEKINSVGDLSLSQHHTLRDLWTGASCLVSQRT